MSSLSTEGWRWWVSAGPLNCTDPHTPESLVPSLSQPLPERPELAVTFLLPAHNFLHSCPPQIHRALPPTRIPPSSTPISSSTHQSQTCPLTLSVHRRGDTHRGGETQPWRHTWVHTGKRISTSTSTHTSRCTHSPNLYKQVHIHSGTNAGTCKQTAPGIFRLMCCPHAGVLGQTGTNRDMHIQSTSTCALLGTHTCPHT